MVAVALGKTHPQGVVHGKCDTGVSIVIRGQGFPDTPAPVRAAGEFLLNLRPADVAAICLGGPPTERDRRTRPTDTGNSQSAGSGPWRCEHGGRRGAETIACRADPEAVPRAVGQTRHRVAGG